MVQIASMPPGHLVVHRSCQIMVVVSSSDATHYPAYTTEPFDKVGLRWVRPVFIDESRFSREVTKGATKRFAGIYITNGALAMPEVRNALKECRQEIREFLEAGGGLVVSGRSFMQNDEVDLDFIPGQFPIALYSTERRNFCGQNLRAPRGHRPLTGDDFRVRSGNDWTDLQVTTQTAYGWETLLEVDDANTGLSQPVALRSQFGVGRIIVSVLPLELLDNSALLNELVREAVRGSTHLIYSRDLTFPPLERLEPGTAVLSAPTVSADGGCYSIEESIRIAARISLEDGVEWSDIQGVKEELVLAHLENYGAFDFLIPGPARPVHCRVDGMPRYLQVLRSAEDRISPILPNLATGLTFHIFAFAILCRIANQVVRSAPQLPRTYGLEQLRDIVQSAVLRRFDKGNVDNLLLPTVALACASFVAGAGIPPGCIEWVLTNSSDFSDDLRAQALWYCRMAGCHELERSVREPITAPSSLPGRLVQQLRSGELSPTSFHAESPLDQAILAISKVVFDGDPLVHQENGRYRESGISTEAICFFVAAEVRQAGEEPLAAGSAFVFDSPPAIPDVSGMLKDRLRVEIDMKELDPLRVQYELALAAGRRVLVILAGVIGIMAAGLILLVGSGVVTATIDIPTGISLAGIILAAMLGLLAAVASSPPLRSIAPRFIMRLHELWERVKTP